MNILSSKGDNLITILRRHKVSIYMVGHLHNGFGEHIPIHRNKSPYWELEMRDFKANGQYYFYII